MTRRALILLGAFAFETDSTPVTSFSSLKAQALLAYLAVESHADKRQTFSRRGLAGLLWPEIGERYALQNLRNTLYELRRTLRQTNDDPASALLDATRTHVHFHADRLSVDVAEFQSLLAGVSTHAHAGSTICEECLVHLSQAVALYHGELLAGFTLPDAPAFEEWLLLRRELLHQQALLATNQLVEIYEARGALDNAHQTVHRLLELDPIREDSHRSLIRICAKLGLPEQALSHYQKLRRLLLEEFGAEPSQETVDLVQQIAAGEFYKPHGGQAETAQRSKDEATEQWSRGGERYHLVPSPPHDTSSQASQLPGSPAGLPDLHDVPLTGRFYGRQMEQTQITRWLLEERCRLVTILGLGGIGKTSLAAHCVRKMVGGFDVIVWNSLLNAPPLQELLPPLLQTLSKQRLKEIPPTIDAQLALLARYMRADRILLILDNMESILESRQPDRYLPGYEAYDQLLNQVAIRDHRSQILVTSRERPPGYARLEGDTPLVRSLRLDGLDASAGGDLLVDRGISATSEQKSELLRRYSGNPLALKLVADTVAELFFGDVKAFLADETIVFNDIRTVLDQQFGRLSALEQEILFWLAINREPTTLAQIRNDLLHAPPQRQLIEALRALQRRSLVEQQEGSFALQNVVTEYLTDRLIMAACDEIESSQFRILRHHALLNAQGKTYVRESQARLLLAPIGKQLKARLGRSGLQGAIQRALNGLREQGFRKPGYTAGNLLNLLLQLDLVPEQANFSHLNIRRAHLQGTSLARVDFSHADFADTAFTTNFGRIKTIAISPDSTLLALGTDDGEVRLWRLADGQLIRMLQGHRSLVISVAFSPDSRTLVGSSSLDGAIYLWDVATGDRLTTFLGHQGGVDVVAFHPNGSVVASGGKDGTIRLWDTRTGRQLQILEKHEDWVVALAFHPQGQLLASGGLGEHECCLWRLSNSGGQGEFLQALAGHGGLVNDVAFSPNGAQLATAGPDATVRLWDVSDFLLNKRAKDSSNHSPSNAMRVLNKHSDDVRSIAFGPKGDFLASGGADFTIRLWDTATGEQLHVLRKHNYSIWAIAVSSDGQTLASGGTDGIVHLWDLHNLRQEQVIRTLHGYVQPIYALAVHPGKHLCATGENDGRVRLWRLVSDDGTELETPATPTVRKAVTLEPLRVLQGHATMVDSVAFSPDGCCLVSGSHDESAQLWDVETGESIARFHAPTRSGVNVAFHPQGQMVACNVFDEIHLWVMPSAGSTRAPASGASLVHAVFHGHVQPIRRMAFSPDGRMLASYGLDETVRLWNVATGECLHIFHENVSSLWSLVFSPNGEWLAGGGRSGIHIWALRTCTRIYYSAMTQATNIRPVAFNPDGKRLVSGGVDRMVRVWDLENDVELYSLDGHAADITSTYFLPDGDTVISASYDGSIRLWDIGCGPDGGTCRQTVRIPGPYEGMNITGVTGISEAQRAALKALGAVEDGRTRADTR